MNHAIYDANSEYLASTAAENRAVTGHDPPAIEGRQGKKVSYWPSRTPDEWRAYHREYYRKNAERRRQQKNASHQRIALIRAYARYGDIVPKRVIRMLFLREGSAP